MQYLVSAGRHQEAMDISERDHVIAELVALFAEESNIELPSKKADLSGVIDSQRLVLITEQKSECRFSSKISSSTTSARLKKSPR
jgi:hypothetical protein